MQALLADLHPGLGFWPVSNSAGEQGTTALAYGGEWVFKLSGHIVGVKIGISKWDKIKKRFGEHGGQLHPSYLSIVCFHLFAEARLLAVFRHMGIPLFPDTTEVLAFLKAPNISDRSAVFVLSVMRAVSKEFVPSKAAEAAVYDALPEDLQALVRST